MTIKEIAELCGVTEQTIRNWTHKVAGDPTKNLQGLTIKLQEAEKSGTTPADFTLEETLVIIGDGGNNKTLAALLADNAALKNAITIRTEATTRLERLEKAVFAEHLASINYDPEAVQQSKIKRFLVENLNITGRRQDFTHADDLWRRFRQLERDNSICIDALLFAVEKTSLSGISVVRKRAYKGLRGCRLRLDDY
ncbi:MAG: hypothetical protein FWC97_00525 [Treponema sp.]|nr:hypothetical protein [Treponema sp.]